MEFGTITKKDFGTSKIVDGRLSEKIPTMLLTYFINFGLQPMLPRDMVSFLKTLTDVFTILDIGAAVGHFTHEARSIFSSASIYMLDALDELAPYYQHLKDEKIISDYYVNALSDKSDYVKYYITSVEHMGGNSLARELTPAYSEDSFRMVKTKTLDEVVESRGWDCSKGLLCKIDVQSLECQIVRGGLKTLKNCSYLILELQHKQYNAGAILFDEAVKELADMGFKLAGRITPLGVYDADYLFIRAP